MAGRGSPESTVALQLSTSVGVEAGKQISCFLTTGLDENKTLKAAESSLPDSAVG